MKVVRKFKVPRDISMLETSKEAVEAAPWLTPADEGTIALLLKLAHRLDDPDFPFPNGRYDNVTEGLFLKTSHALGLTPEMRKLWEKKEAAKTGGGRLDALRKSTSNLHAV